MIKAIFFVITGKCGGHKAGLMLERFDVEKDTLANYSSLKKKVSKLNDNIASSQNSVAKIQSLAETFQPELCYVLKQIDDSNEGNYSSNVPEDELLLPADQQKKRAAERAIKAKKYVERSKKSFSEIHGAPIVECFGEVADSLADLKEDIKGTESNMSSLVESFNEIKAIFSKTDSYDVTLKYNDKYIKKLADAATAPKSEGFYNYSAALESNPTLHVEDLEARYKALKTEIDIYGVTIKKYINAIKLQKSAVKAAKAPVTDPNVQKETLNSSYAVNSGK